MPLEYLLLFPLFNHPLQLFSCPFEFPTVAQVTFHTLPGTSNFQVKIHQEACQPRFPSFSCFFYISILSANSHSLACYPPKSSRPSAAHFHPCPGSHQVSRSQQLPLASFSNQNHPGVLHHRAKPIKLVLPVSLFLGPQINPFCDVKF